MSTTVTYKGQTLTTVSNDTKTLLTEGKYLEDDLTLTDVSGGGAVLTTKNISANGTYNASSDSADGYSQVAVSVPASAVDTGTKNITANGTHDVVGYASANVNVPNSYSASDEGKVVSSGALVAQTAHADVTPTTSDQTIDTATNNSVKVKGDADLVAANIKKDVEIFGVTGSYEGGGGGSDETGSFVASANQSDITISVTALHSHIYIWDSVVKGDDDLSSEPYGTKKMIFMFADGNTGLRSWGGISTAGTAFYSNNAFGGIGRWGNNTSWSDRVEFTPSTIKLINTRINGTTYHLIDGHTYNWRAW